MNQNANQHANENISESSYGRLNPVWVAAVLFLCVVAVAVGFIVQQQKVASQLSARNEELTASLTQTKGQVQNLSSVLNTMQAQQAAREKAAEEARRTAELRRERIRHQAGAKKVVNRDEIGRASCRERV